MSKKILVVASGGGHWDQIMRLRTAFEGHQVTYVTTMTGLGERAGLQTSLVADCNRNEKVAIMRCAMGLAAIIVRKRPKVIITTGALPGLIAISIGKLTGAKSLWIDSIANTREMSMSGQKARTLASKCISQWPDLANSKRADYWGAVL